jgi:hypothetical protein
MTKLEALTVLNKLDVQAPDEELDQLHPHRTRQLRHRSHLHLHPHVWYSQHLHTQHHPGVR